MVDADIAAVIKATLGDVQPYQQPYQQQPLDQQPFGQPPQPNESV